MKFLARSCEKSLSPRSTRKIISFIELRIVSKKFVESVVVSSRTLSTRKESHGRSNGKTTRVEKEACCIIVEKTGWDRNRFQTMENVNAFSVYVKSLYERKKIFSTDFLFPLFLLSLPPHFSLKDRGSSSRPIITVVSHCPVPLHNFSPRASPL